MNVSVLGATVHLDTTYIHESDPDVTGQLDEYLRGDRRTFDLTIDYPNTFTGRVMRAMTRIPYGQTRSYGTLAETLDTAPIAVGQACGRNPIPLIVPCHRVVAADGLGGYSAGGDQHLQVKQGLIDLEHANTTARITA